MCITACSIPVEANKRLTDSGSAIPVFLVQLVCSSHHTDVVHHRLDRILPNRKIDNCNFKPFHR